ncbi:MAG: Mop flippase family exporter [Bacteroidetes bacterium HLUCCA01]|nr:MAG: Mop flippase family exporter [Bacteroidetes bacterium HLUCCA01]
MSLTNKTLGGFIWAFLERFGTQVLQIVVFIILARILSPDAFGLMGMLAVFIAVSQSITDSGFGQALIQKKDTDEIDYSSVFYMNMGVSIGMYLILFVSAPYISAFYNEPELTNLVRVLGLRFILSAFSLVQIARLTKGVEFKKLMLAKVPSTLLGGIAGIVGAYTGLGVWSLVLLQLVDTAAYSIQVWIQSQWYPQKVFQWNRVKQLFDFGGKMMLESVLSTIYKNISELVIGRYFSTAQVGFYTQANKFKQLPVKNISSALDRVTFPVLSDIQNDDKRLKIAYKKIVRQVFFIITPIMIGAIVLAEPLFRVVLTEKWLPAVPYFQWLCVSGILYPVQAYNLNILKVKGRSDLFLYLGFVKKAIGITGIFIFIQYSVLALVMFRAVNSFLAYYINSYYSGKFINYGMFEQIKDIWRFWAISALAGGTVWYITHLLSLNDYLEITIGLVVGFTIYMVMTYLFERPIIKYSLDTISKFKASNKKV